MPAFWSFQLSWIRSKFWQNWSITSYLHQRFVQRPVICCTMSHYLSGKRGPSQGRRPLESSGLAAFQTMGTVNNKVNSWLWFGCIKKHHIHKNITGSLQFRKEHGSQRLSSFISRLSIWFYLTLINGRIIPISSINTMEWKHGDHHQCSMFTAG